MGNCSHSRAEHASSTYFEVFNVDARLFTHSRGQLQITSDQMVLNQSNQRIRWPFNGIRSYGYHKDIFLFESGRRCQTGEGLFAFKCNNAKRLNNQLHKAIKNASSTVPNNQTSDNNVTLIPNPNLKNNKIEDSSTSNIEINNFDSNKHSSLSSYSQNLSDTNSNTHPEVQLKTEKDLNYVNQGIISICLPESLSFANSENKSYTNDYVNCDQIDPALLHLVRKVNVDCSNYSFKRPLLSGSSPKLNYIPHDCIQRLKRNDDSINQENGLNNKLNCSNNLTKESKNSFSLSDESSRLDGSEKNNDYVAIDSKKTAAIESSTDLIKFKKN